MLYSGACAMAGWRVIPPCCYEASLSRVSAVPPPALHSGGGLRAHSLVLPTRYLKQPDATIRHRVHRRTEIVLTLTTFRSLDVSAMCALQARSHAVGSGSPALLRGRLACAYPRVVPDVLKKRKLKVMNTDPERITLTISLHPNDLKQLDHACQRVGMRREDFCVLATHLEGARVLNGEGLAALARPFNFAAGLPAALRGAFARLCTR